MKRRISNSSNPLTRIQSIDKLLDKDLVDYSIAHVYLNIFF